MTIKTVLKGSVAAAALFAVAAPVSPAQAGSIAGGNDNNLTVSGQVNRAVLYYRDGKGSEVTHVDNTNSNTRVRFVAKGKLNEAVSVGSNMEVAFSSNPSASVSNAPGGLRGGGTNNFTERLLNVHIDHKQFGRLTMGQANTASNGTSEVDLSPGVALYSSVADIAGGLQFRRSKDVADGNPLTMGVPGDTAATKDSRATFATTSSVYNNFDGLSRDDIIRYDTPTVAGFKISASNVSGSDANDVSLRYAGKFGGVKFQSAVSYVNAQTRSYVNTQNTTVGATGFKGFNGSFSVKHDSGAGLTFASASRTFRDRDAVIDEEDVKVKKRTGRFYYGKLFYGAKLTPLGTTTFQADGGSYRNVLRKGGKAYALGGAVVQNLDKVGSELYLGYRYYNLSKVSSADTNKYDAIHAAFTGMRVKF